MSDLPLQIVREFFELHLFHVLTPWQCLEVTDIPAETREWLFVQNTRPLRRKTTQFHLHPENVEGITRALVEVRIWNTEMYPSVIEANPSLGKITSASILALATEVFDTTDFATILIISELPLSYHARERSLQLLQGFKIGHVMEFGAILRDIIQRLDTNLNYSPSITLQTIRYLKRFRCLSEPQLEFSLPFEPPLYPMLPGEAEKSIEGESEAESHLEEGLEE